MRHSLFLFLAGALLLGCRPKHDLTGWQYSDPMKDPDPRWAHIDSLENNGLFADALTATEALLSEAQGKDDWRNVFRATLRRADQQQAIGTSEEAVLQQLDQSIPQDHYPLKQLLHSAVAERWWQYYQNNRWTILERTNIGSVTSSAVETWSQAQFINKIIHHFRASLQPEDSLKATPTSILGDLLLNPEGTITEDPKSAPLSLGEGTGVRLRPTLFDILAHRALDVFRNTETRLAEPSWSFKLNDPRAFALFEAFANKPFAHRDSTSWEFQALRLYQQLEAKHLVAAKPDALVDVTLQRLAYVRERSTLPNKDTLYLNALETLASRVPKDTCWGDVLMAQARWHAEMGEKYDRSTEGGPATAPWKWERSTARVLCDKIIARFPASFAARNARALKARLEEPSLQLFVEEAVSPNEPFRVALGYTNTKQVWLRVVEDKATVEERFGQEREQTLLKARPINEWNVALPDDGDLNNHLIELPVAGPPLGHYAVLVSTSPDFAARKDVVVHASFWSTQLSISARSNGPEVELLVVDRITGAPIKDAIAKYWINTYQSGGARFKSSSDFLSTDENGTVRAVIPGSGSQVKWSVTKGGDEYIGAQQWIGPGRVGPEGPQLRTLLFTDRAIYRPGQPIEFKGIATVRNGKNTEVIAKRRTTMKLFDANGELVDSVNITTDSYGSFSGKFKAPGGLTGQLRIQEEHGSKYLQVEEYKRPTFEVVFDPITAAPKLEQQAEVTGVAKSYAGVPLDGAQVKWTVTRNARMPWWCGWGWRGFPGWGRSTEIASGTAETDATGKFTVKFLATADASLPRQADPTFTYTVEASITDINGETQSSNTALSVGYRSIDIALNVGESIDRSATDSLDVRVQNLNGQDVDVPMTVRIHELVLPDGTPEVQRLWQRPDRVLDGEPAIDPAREDPAQWKRRATVLDKSGHRAKGKELSLKGIKDWPVGSYLIEVIANDADGNEVKATKHITLFDPDIQNTGFVNEAFHVERISSPLLGRGAGGEVEPGTKAILLLSSALSEANALMEIERDGIISAKRWFKLTKGQQRVEIPVTEEDRGGFTVHFLCVERGRAHREQVFIAVPWTNKQLQVQWSTFRDKLLPGAKEEWRLKISGPKGEKVAAQLLAGMYDASLDHFVPHGWDMDIWHGNYPRLGWDHVEPFGMSGGQGIYREVVMPQDTSRIYPFLITGSGWDRYRHFRGNVLRGGRAEGTYAYFDGVEVAGQAFAADSDGAIALSNSLAWSVSGNAKPLGKDENKPTDQSSAQQPSARTDFRETAFFFPDLLADKDGSIVLRFTMPEALTRWKFMGLAHTTDLKTTQFTKEVVTQKPLMVTPNLPRFMRAGDRITLTAKVSALEGKHSGTASLELFDPYTNKPIAAAFSLKSATRPFSVAPGQNANVAWDITVPEGVDMVSMRITANSSPFEGGRGMGHSDGEEKPLPILTDKLLVTESLPLWSSKAGTKTFTLNKLKNCHPELAEGSTTLKHQSLKLEYTPNPAWYAVQALPYLMEFPHECAEQTFSRFYANALAAHIGNERPSIKKVFDQWRSTSLPTGEGRGGVAFTSALEKNTDLKNIILAETPWVMNARSDRERKERIALLFDIQRMADEEATALKKLRDMQLPNGAWPWWSGMRESRYITQHIVAGLGHLEKLGAADLRPDGQVQVMLRNAVQWLDADVDREYRELAKRTKKEDLEKYAPSTTDIHFLYTRSFFPRWPIDGATATAANFYKQRLATTWLNYGLQEQGMIALALHRLGDKSTAAAIMESLRQRATQSEELGMHWKNFNGGYDWWQFPAETYALMIEAYHEVANDQTSVNELRTYLLKLKQTTDWKTTKATSEACYALLLTGDDWLAEDNAPLIKVGGVELKADKSEVGTSAMEKSWSAAEIKPAMADVTITTTADKPSWGALHWQYFERMDKITPHESPFSIRKEVFLMEQTEEGARLVAVTGDQAVKPGDKLTIRIELRADRYVDYVHMKDLRAAGLEPTEALSGYKYQGGLGYYQSIRDASMNFFFDRIAPGTYVFEYTLRVTHAGDFSNGITTAQCMYAPEFSSHSGGVRVAVSK
ncbi:MAG: hypothetical protein IPJ76_07815 [Flavobacteriales bacterium]|nr:MAG: hypothetical protein IPJ76_07815 [Flavobacteriales bacterium]